jgi:hypothetical protein
MASSSSSSGPNSTLYINNLNDKITKDELKSQLYALFSTYGRIIDIVALKGQRMKGQAFLVFADLAGATTAMRACEGMLFYDKPMVSIFLRRVFMPFLTRALPQAYCICKNQILRYIVSRRSQLRSSKLGQC